MIHQKHIDFLESRGISGATAIIHGVYSDGQNLAFPIKTINGLVGVKFRGPNKKFFFKEGSTVRMLWEDQIALAASKGESVWIVEGELDALTLYENGVKYVVSVPNGTGTNLDILADIDGLQGVRDFIIATDADEAGEGLKVDLVERLSEGYCSEVRYPAGCKDINEVFLAHGEEGIADVVASVKPMKVKGLHQFGEREEEEIDFLSTGWENVDKSYQPFLGSMTVLTGTPGAGKSKFAMHYLAQMMVVHDHATCLVSPEVHAGFINDEFRTVIACSAHANGRPELLERKLSFIDDEDYSREFTVDYLLEMATIAKRRYNIKHLVIDPWNRLEHKFSSTENQVEQQRNALKRIARWAKQYQVAVMVVAHPTKSVASASGEIRIPTGYDIDGSAHWYNNPDYVIALMRGGEGFRTLVQVNVQKVRYQIKPNKNTAQPMDIGQHFLRFMHEGRFIETIAPPSD